jgi:sugar (pentulose or hexulose) kinase
MVYSWTDRHGKLRCGTWSRGVRQAFKCGAAHAYLQNPLGRVLPKWKTTSTSSGSVQPISALRTKQAEHTLQCLKKLRNHRLGVMENRRSCRRGARQILLEDESQSLIILQTSSKEFRAFNLNPRFRPFMNHSRQERIARAQAFGKQVPHLITEILSIFCFAPILDCKQNYYDRLAELQQ